MRLKVRIIFVLLSLLSAVSSYAIEDRREFRVINASNDLADNSAQVVVCTKTGRMIISTLGNLNFYDGTSFTHIDTRQEYQYQLPLYRGNYHLYFDRFHHIWLKNTNTVTCVDLLQEQFIGDVSGVLRDCFELETPVQDLFVDSIGDVWFLTEKGLYGSTVKKTYTVLRDRNLQDVDVIDSMLVTFYDNGEEMGIDLKTGNILHRTKAYEWDEAQYYTNSSVIKRYGNGFFQIRNGRQRSVLLYFDISTLTWTKLAEFDYTQSNMAVRNDMLYVACAYGYWIYDLKTGEKTHVEELQIANGKGSLRTSCNTIAFDRQGGLWIGTEQRGLLYARPFASPFNIYSWDNPIALKYEAIMRGIDSYVGEFKGMQTNCRYEDSRGWTWFGTTMGLYMYRTPKSEPVVFTRKTGLLNNVIHSIVEDKSHNIWLSTSCGISCILFEGDKVVFVNSFNEKDNVPNESFVNCKAVCMDDGTIAMQSIDHVVTFNPDQFEAVNGRNPIGLYPKLITMLVNGNIVEPGEDVGGNVIIDRAITRMHDISLNADQNSISLVFSGLNYFRPTQTYYRVRVKGLDEEWRVLSYFDSNGMVDQNGRLHLPLVALKPGEYEVEVQASMLPDVWSNPPFTWIIHVNQPWWQTTGVYFLIGFLILVMMVINLVYYSRNTRMRARLNSGEGDLIRKISSFVMRTEAVMNGVYGRTNDDTAKDMKESKFDPEFLQAMVRIIPYVLQHKQSRFTVRRLSEVGGLDVAEFYDVMTSHLNKKPRYMARYILLQQAAKLLRSTNKTVEEIADECHFYSPNYFMGNFFHEFKMTPREYRLENSEES